MGWCKGHENFSMCPKRMLSLGTNGESNQGLIANPGLRGKLPLKWHVCARVIL